MRENWLLNSSQSIREIGSLVMFIIPNYVMFTTGTLNEKELQQRMPIVR